MSKKIILDFDNDFVIFDIPSQKGTEYNDKLDKLKIINAIGNLDAEIYMSLCKSGIIGFDFENKIISVYQPITYDRKSGCLYPESLLKERNSVLFAYLDQKYNDIVDAMGYHEESIQDDATFQLIDFLLSGKYNTENE